jgi:hypothetical protein
VLIVGAWFLGVVMVWPDPAPGAAIGGLLAGLNGVTKERVGI